MKSLYKKVKDAKSVIELWNLRGEILEELKKREKSKEAKE